VISYGTRGLSISLLALEGFAFIVELLAATDTDLKLGETTPEINFGRHQGQSFLCNLLHQLVDLKAMQQQFTLSQRIVVFAIALFIGTDVHIIDEQFTIANAAIGFLDTDLPHAHGFHLSALQGQAGFYDFIDKVLVISLFIVGDYFYTHINSTFKTRNANHAKVLSSGYDGIQAARCFTLTSCPALQSLISENLDNFRHIAILGQSTAADP